MKFCSRYDRYCFLSCRVFPSFVISLYRPSSLGFRVGYLILTFCWCCLIGFVCYILLLGALNTIEVKNLVEIASTLYGYLRSEYASLIVDIKKNIIGYFYIFCKTILVLYYTKEAYNILRSEITHRYIIYNWQLKNYISKLSIKYLNVLKDIFYNKLLLIKNNYKSILRELFWTILPSVILILIAFPSFKLLYLMDGVIDPSSVIYEEGYQWYWSYQYPDYLENLALDTDIMASGLPEGGGGGWLGGPGEGSGAGLPGQPNPGGGFNANNPVLPDPTSKDSQKHLQGTSEPNPGEGSKANLTDSSDQNPLTNSPEVYKWLGNQVRNEEDFFSTKTWKEVLLFKKSFEHGLESAKMKAIYGNYRVGLEPSNMQADKVLGHVLKISDIHSEEVKDLQPIANEAYRLFVNYVNKIPGKDTVFTFSGSHGNKLCWREIEDYWTYTVANGDFRYDSDLDKKFIILNNYYVKLYESHMAISRLEDRIGFKLIHLLNDEAVVNSRDLTRNFAENGTPGKLEAILQAKLSIRGQIPKNVFKDAENRPR